MMYGANPQQLRDLATKCAAAADTLRQATWTVNTVIARTPWRGGAADQFRGRWQSVDRAKIEGASAALEDAAAVLRRNADDQDRASGAETGSGVPVVVDESSAFAAQPWLAVSMNLNDALQKVDTALGYGTGIVDLAKSGLFAPMTRGLWNMGSVALSGTVAVADYFVQAAQHGFGSSEAAASAVDGTISTVVSGVPGGSIAYGSGKVIGQVLWNVGLGDRIMSESFITGFEGDVNTLNAGVDAALASGDFEEATRLSRLAQAEASSAAEASSGYTGIWNSTTSVVSTLFRIPTGRD